MKVGIVAFASAFMLIQAQQCPCLLKPNGDCLVYDSRFMAMNLEEAIVSFPDLLWTDPPNPVDVQNPGPSSSHCITEECVACQHDIRRRLTEIGLGHFNVSKRSNRRCTRYHLPSYNYKGGDVDSDHSHSESWEERNLEKHHFRGARYAERNFTGYAKCKEGLRNVEVIRNDSGVLTAVLLTSGTYCECRATQYSPIYNLIIGSDVDGK